MIACKYLSHGPSRYLQGGGKGVSTLHNSVHPMQHSLTDMIPSMNDMLPETDTWDGIDVDGRV